MSIKGRILKYIEYKGISKYKFYQETGFSNGLLDKDGTIGADKCERISYQYPDLSLDWLITGNGDMIKSGDVNANIGNGQQIIASNVQGGISADNRQYYSDSPDVLRAQIDEKERILIEKENIMREKDERLREKDERLREKDERLREKDEYIQELRETIKELKANNR